MFDIIYDESAEYRFGEFFEQLNDHHFFNTSEFLISKSGKPELIGSGGSSLVFRGITIDEKIKKNVAIKVIFADNVNDNVRASEEAEKQHEISTYYKDGIIPILETKSIAIYYLESICPIFDNEDNNHERFHFIVMDEMKPIVISYEAESKKYELDRVLIENKEEQILKMASNVLTTLSICHSKEEPVYHRDIKPENIFYSDINSSYKVGDFGISSDINESIDAGTKLYMAPEVIEDYKNYSGKSDVYSLGYTLLILLNNGNFVDLNKDKEKIIEEIGAKDTKIKELVQLVLEMCNCDAEKRLSCEEALDEIKSKITQHQSANMNTRDLNKMITTLQKSELDRNRLRKRVFNKELYKLVYKTNFSVTEGEIKKLRKMKENNCDDCFKLACYYDFVSSIKSDTLEAEGLYLKAADLGCSIARVFYANCVLSKKGKKNKHLAIIQLLQAMIEGSSWAYVVLGDAMSSDNIYSFNEVEGLGIRNIYLDVYDCFNRALEIDKKNAYANYRMAVLYYDKSLMDEACEYCAKAIEMGEPKAMSLLGDIFYDDEGVEGHKEIAFYCYMRAAEQDDAHAQYNIGCMYYEGEVVEENKGEAFNWFMEAAKQDDARAQYNIGCMYYEGEVVEENKGEAFNWFMKAAKQGNASAQLAIGIMYYKGEGVESGKEEAFNWFMEAAKQEVADAQFNIGNMYYNGEGVEEDKEEAFNWYKKAAEQGNTYAKFKIGYMYYNGEGVEENKEEAFNWFMKAANQGNASAQLAIGIMYYKGEGVEENKEEAFNWFMEAAKQDDAHAQYKIGCMYFKGEVVEENKEEAFNWFMEAAKQDDAHAQYNIGNMYYEGEVVEENKEEAFNWFMEAAKQDDADAQFNIGNMYRYGEGVEENKEEAITWYKKATNQEHARAQLAIGIMYYKGEGVEENKEEAYRWIKLAADQEYENAQVIIGVMYYKGEGVEENKEEAYTWFKLAAEKGSREAQKMIIQLENESSFGESVEPIIKSINIEGNNKNRE